MLLFLLAGCAAQPPAGGAAFILMGDTPYFASEVERLDLVIEELNGRNAVFIAHVGDITSGQGPCTDEWFEARKRQFARLRHPFVLLPGDNDWTDCHRSGFDPVERLAKWRTLFCVQVVVQDFERQNGAYCEHVRWQAGGYLFVALNVQGSNNNFGRNAAMDAEHAARMRAVLAWIDDAQRLFLERRLNGLVLLMQANPFLVPRSGPNGFVSTLERLRQLATIYPGRVVLVNGDTHTFRDDQPLPGLRRIEVPGSPFVGWLEAAIAGAELRVSAPRYR